MLGFYSANMTTNYGSIVHNGANTFYNTSSDQRRKRKIRPSTRYGLQTLRQLAVRDWEWDTKPGEVDTGLIGQEVKDIYPPAVTYDATQDAYYLDYSRFTILLIRALQELDAEVQRLGAGRR
jgi:hypothetical protein